MNTDGPEPDFQNNLLILEKYLSALHYVLTSQCQIQLTLHNTNQIFDIFYLLAHLSFSNKATLPLSLKLLSARYKHFSVPWDLMLRSIGQ